MTFTMTWNKIDTNPVTGKNWNDDLKKSVEPVALQQAHAYGVAFMDYHATTYQAIIKKDTDIIALCQFFQYRLLNFIPVLACFKGPIWLKDLSYDQKITVLNFIKNHHPIKRHLFILESNLTNLPHNKILKYRRVITGASTIWLDLSLSQEKLRQQLKGKWRNALVRAEKSPITVKKYGKSPDQYQWLIDAEKTQRRERRYWSLPSDFVTQFIKNAPNNQPILTLGADLKKERIAGMMFLIHGNSATYHIGWSNDTGRQYNAHNLLLWRAMLTLKERGIRYLDLGGINNKDLPGLTRFKIGTGGHIITYAGTYMPKIFGLL